MWWIWKTNGTNSQSVRNLMRDHFLYKFLHFPCINSHLTAFALASLLTPPCQEKGLNPPPPTQTQMMKGYIHFISRGCQWLFKEFRSPLSWVKQLWQQERLLIGLVSFQVFFYHLLAWFASCYWWWVQVLGAVFALPRAPHCVFCTFRCDLLLGLETFFFPSLVPLPGVFSLFIY
jgi:hypothetical protein